MTIAQQLKIKEFPFEIKDSKGNQIYWENSDGDWVKREWDSEGNGIYHENSDEYWVKYKWDSDGNRIYLENSEGFWSKREYDSKSNLIYWENSDGTITDNRPKTDVEKALELLEKEGYQIFKYI